MLPPSQREAALTNVVNPGPFPKNASEAEIYTTKARAMTTAKLAAAVSKRGKGK